MKVKEPRAAHSSARLSDGRVLIAGGRSPDSCCEESPEALAGTEIFGPDTGTSTDAGPMARGRSLHSATLLPDGRVLILGGFDSMVYDEASDTIVATAGLCDPEAGVFVPTDPPIDPRDGHSA